ncbi:hypothetical protein O4H49_03265 [Kiloniella laminariae]|uniref:Uncharacterized protein n=1 Tax=Kiloniella laminariae TaxID=454162 RepID=A0ABT4LFB5_9PROT|nr:hypothetical protein [Kiloniella laminariae]MCZ4279783.1 hypothetical protein [Kiloniella laminariae]
MTGLSLAPVTTAKARLARRNDWQDFYRQQLALCEELIHLPEVLPPREMPAPTFIQSPKPEPEPNPEPGFKTR